MIRISLLMALFVGIAGCASGSPEAPAVPAGDGPKVAASDSATSGAGTDSNSPDQVDSSSSGIDFMEAPEVENVAAVPETRDEMVCRRVRLTGSHRLEKICRPRSEINETMRDTQEAVRRMERSTQATKSR